MTADSRATDQLTFKDDEIIRILNKVYLGLRDGLFDKSVDLLDEALRLDVEYPGLTAALKCATYWRERQTRLEEMTDAYQKGEFLLNQWQMFTTFLKRIGEAPERCVLSIKQHVFSTALASYLALYDDSGRNDPELQLRIGKCYKVIGNYERAIEHLETASRNKRESPEVLAELADSYSLVNEVRAAKVFFREAFFIDSRTVDLASIESPMMQRLVEKLKGMRFGEQLPEWIPVYATIWGVFNIKRELRPLELGKLKQSIYSLEKALAHEQEKHSDLVPRLINHYFWLIDHYVSTKEEQQRIEEVILKIRDLEPAVYREYTH